MEKMKQHFKDSFRLAYGDTRMPSHQLKMAIMIFGMGWCEALVAKGFDEEAKAFLEECAEFGNGKWLPDESWYFWS